MKKNRWNISSPAARTRILPLEPFPPIPCEWEVVNSSLSRERRFGPDISTLWLSHHNDHPTTITPEVCRIWSYTDDFMVKMRSEVIQLQVYLDARLSCESTRKTSTWPKTRRLPPHELPTYFSGFRYFFVGICAYSRWKEISWKKFLPALVDWRNWKCYNWPITNL